MHYNVNACGKFGGKISHIMNLSSGHTWVISFTLGEQVPGTCWTGGWDGLMTVLDKVVKREEFHIYSKLNFCYPVHSLSLY